MTYAVWLEPASVRESVPVYALGLDSAIEEDVSDRHNEVVDDTAASDQADLVLVSVDTIPKKHVEDLLDQPSQHFVGSVAELHERETGETHNHKEAVEWYTILGAVTQHFRRTTFKGQSV